MGWLPNSGGRMQCCIGKFIDEIGGIVTTFMINVKKNTLTLMVLAKNESGFLKSPYYIQNALVKKSYLRGKRVIWYTFDLTIFLMEIKRRGLC